jgi:hypothetical protein
VGPLDARRRTREVVEERQRQRTSLDRGGDAGGADSGFGQVLDQLHPQGIAFAERFASARPRPDDADSDQLCETLDGRSGAGREILLRQPIDLS